MAASHAQLGARSVVFAGGMRYVVGGRQWMTEFFICLLLTVRQTFHRWSQLVRKVRGVRVRMCAGGGAHAQ